MSVPEQVRKQTEAVQALYNDLENPTSPENGEVAPAPVVEPLTVVANSVPEVAPTPTPVEQGNGDQEETFEQKYRTLQGMYNAEVPRLTASNQDLSARLQSMEQLVATMNTAPAPVAEPAPVPVLTTLTDEEVSEYGESIDIMRKVSQEVAGQYQGQIAAMQSTIDELRGSVVPRVEQIATQQVQNAEQTFWSDLATTVPNWRDINGDQDFQTWLLETDPLSGLTRQTYLDDAQRNLDVVRVGNFFTSWASSTGANTALSDRSEQTSELERQVAPGKSRSSGAPHGNTKKTYTPQDISKFFDDVRTGKYAGREDERNKTESDIFAAQADGRIVPA